MQDLLVQRLRTIALEFVDRLLRNEKPSAEFAEFFKASDRVPLATVEVEEQIRIDVHAHHVASLPRTSPHHTRGCSSADVARRCVRAASRNSLVASGLARSCLGQEQAPGHEMRSTAASQAQHEGASEPGRTGPAAAIA